MSFYPGDYSELRGFLTETDTGDEPPAVTTTMTTIDEGENVKMRFTARDSEGAPMSTSDIASFSVSLVYQEDDGTYGDILGIWTFTSPSTYSENMEEDSDGVFAVEVLSSQTGTPGILAAVITVEYPDADYFASGNETHVTVAQDILEILDVPTLTTGGGSNSGDTYLTPTGDNYFQPDGTSLYLIP